jgi:hypothetical protein
VGLKLNETRKPLAYADDVNLLGDNIDTIKKNTGTLDPRREAGVEVNAGISSICSCLVTTMQVKIMI